MSTKPRAFSWLSELSTSSIFLKVHQSLQLESNSGHWDPSTSRTIGFTKQPVTWKPSTSGSSIWWSIAPSWNQDVGEIEKWGAIDGSRALNLWVCMLAFYHSAQEPLVVWKQYWPGSCTVAVYPNLKTFFEGVGVDLLILLFLPSRFEPEKAG